ncbi:MAG TPA: methyltransferase domain-containing protein [Candidatus Limnocylindria bacterium]|nr:methyltransferase domain-containing protein [Candidatus Limnocylindria bacterium]
MNDAIRPAPAAPLDRTKFSTIAHTEHRLLSPIDPGRLDRLFALLELGPNDLALDVGCGKAEMLIRLIERFGVRAVGVDLNTTFLGEARIEAEARGVADRLVLHPARFDDVPLPTGHFALAIASGAGAAFGGYRETLRALGKLVRPGGLLVIGEGHWKREPDPDYLAVLGGTRDESEDLHGNVAAAEAEGLIPLYVCVSSDQDWDHYEGLYARAIERYAAAHPEDPDRDRMLERIRNWRDAYFRWGRDTLGFALYLLRKP